MDKIKIGIVGSKFAAMLHAESYKRLPSVLMHSVAAIDNLDEFANEYQIPNRYGDYKESLSEIINDKKAQKVYEKTLEIHEWLYQKIN